ncbi:zinc finger, RING-type protein [Pseudohyphozyma bogoriensis]|nr:zinc finger, RING-type protein [Pseudohyphozyma bogoriensis]
MKYGKQYKEDLARQPKDWQAASIEYSKLKKVIGKVESELKELGLTSEVLKDLLEQRPESPDPPRARPARGTITASDGTADAGPSSGGAREDGKEDSGTQAFVEEVKERSRRGSMLPADAPKLKWESSDEEDASGVSVGGKGKRRATRMRRRATAKYELGGTSERPEPRIHLVFDSASSHSYTESSSCSDEENEPLFNVDTNVDVDTSDTQEEPGRFTEVNSEEEEDSSEKDKDDDDSELGSSSAGNVEGDFEGAGPKENSLLKRMYGLNEHSDDEQDWAKTDVDVEPGRRKSDETLRWEDMSESQRKELVHRAEERVDEHGHPYHRKEQEVKNAEEAIVAEQEDADDEAPRLAKPKRRHHHHRRPRKEVFIPLNSDTEFFSLLAKALSSLAALQLAQKKQFAQAVQLLAAQVSQVSSPSRPKSDLYVWREIFSLWVEAQIFESARERDRGERSVEEAEKKLDWFVDQVAQRKLAKRMKNKESRDALEKFIKLNVQLLDLKRFQLANEEAARKILKKHDKRTALTASLGFPQFIAAASSLTSSEGALTARTPASNTRIRVLNLPGFPSLPHQLLSTLTSTLLPVIPQIEEYECAICGDLAFKPIRLDCGHKFCVRCLVKMQKRGQDHCPQCRSPVVLRATGANLDTAMEEYLELWFPKEVKAKQKQNHKESAAEELEAMGLNGHKCVIQ